MTQPITHITFFVLNPATLVSETAQPTYDGRLGRYTLKLRDGRQFEAKNLTVLGSRVRQYNETTLRREYDA